MLPVVWGSQIPEDVLRTYAARYLREEVQVEGLVRNIGVFSRFLEIISFSHASVLNISNVARECAVERKSDDGRQPALRSPGEAGTTDDGYRTATKEGLKHGERGETWFVAGQLSAFW